MNERIAMSMVKRRFAGVAFLLFFAPCAFAQSSLAGTPIVITADLTEAPRKLYHAEIDLPVSAGSIDLVTPQWIPGNHRPTGPAYDIAGVVFTANGQTLPWRRDDVNIYEFHLTVPAGITTIHAHL